jgi:hypothetical protein
LPLESDRSLLRRRLRYYLERGRRGRLRLPERFPKSVRRLSGMSLAQVRNTAYWVTPSRSSFQRVDHSLDGFAHQVLPGGIWTRRTDSPTAGLRSVGKRLNGRLKTRNSSSAWPSCPDLGEIMGMLRRGRSAPVPDKVNLRVNNSLTARAVRDNVSIATRVVARQIVGVRLEVDVPEKFLEYFRVYHGFLILATRHSLPIGLVRFLIGQWVKHPTSCWLVEHCPYRYYLRRHSKEDFLPSSGSYVGRKCALRARERLGRSKRLIDSGKTRIHRSPRLPKRRGTSATQRPQRLN